MKSVALIFLLLAGARVPGSALNIVSPSESETVVVLADSQGLRVRVDLGADVRVPEHGLSSSSSSSSFSHVNVRDVCKYQY